MKILFKEYIYLKKNIYNGRYRKAIKYNSSFRDCCSIMNFNTKIMTEATVRNMI